MTVYEIKNIEHCTVTPISNNGVVLGYNITANDGWWIHLNNGVEDTVNHWTKIVILLASTDFSIVEIRATEDLPEGAETNNLVNKEEVE